MNTSLSEIPGRFNTGDDRIKYIVETSRDLRTWTSDSDRTNGPLQVGTASMGGGMEKVVYRSREKRTDNGGKQLYIQYG